jgi:TolA-binding protein
MYSVCTYYDYRKEVTFEVLELYTDKQTAINRVIELSQGTYDEGKDDDQIAEDKQSLTAELAELESKLEQLNSEVTRASQTSLTLQQCSPIIQKELAETQKEYQVTKQKLEQCGHVYVFYPKESGWGNNGHVPQYVYPENAIVDSGYDRSTRYCAFEVKVIS